jgi:DNA-binding LacI/PurR family transcriptional regulator
MKHITIKDVARQLNVSVSTISRAFNDKYDIKKETRDRILKAAAEMGYHPNPIAKKLIQRKSYNVGVVVPEFINAFFPEVIIGIQEVLLKKDYQVLIMQSNESYETELNNVKTLEDNMVDGLIVSLSRETKNLDYYQGLIRQGYPLVFFNRTSDALAASKVVFDDFKWSFFATEHLIREGYRKIFHLSAYKNLSLARNRINGYKKAMAKYQIAIDPSWIIETGLYVEEGEKTMQRLIDNNDMPEAIFCVNDMTALGAMRIIKKNGLRIPDDIAIVGFTETPFCPLVDPPLTSVHQPTFEIGQTAARLLLKQMESESYLIPETVVLNGTLNIRASSKKIKHTIPA